jgi:glyoxalase family protein
MMIVILFAGHLANSESESKMDLQLQGIHHLTAITAQAQANYEFYTQTMGLRLVKKTVNQDDVRAYHLFYADGLASPGTDLTFFDWAMIPAEQRGAHSISRTGLRVNSTETLNWWAERLAKQGVTHGEIQARDGRATLDVEDFEGQRLLLVADPDNPTGNAWAASPVPAERQILGLGPVTITVPQLFPTDAVLTRALNMRLEREYANPDAPEHPVHVFAMGPGGAAAELHVAVRPDLPVARQGAGGVHHVAFRVPTYEEYDAWATYLPSIGVQTSGKVDRFYFRSLYFREPNGILFELATDGPGFAVDEPMESLGEDLALPPFLEDRRAAIEANLTPLVQ